MAFSIGQTVGDYRIIEILGSGGMGAVYKVKHLISDRLEAMKVVLPELTENADLSERFMREIKVQARLAHPNIAALHNALRIDNQLLMVMEFVDGQSLHAVLRQGGLEMLAAIGLLIQILNALEYAHAQGVVHRDIKPANIMLTNAGSVKVMDFGIARSAQDEKLLTSTGAAVGSIYYMSPEQVQGGPVDGRADLYSAGILLYEMTTGVRPITGDGSYAVMNGHLHTVPRAPSALNPAIPEALSLSILKAVEKSKERRFQSAREFADALRVASVSSVPALQETIVARPLVRAPTPGTPPSGSGQVAMRFESERLERLTSDLATFVGPMAKVLVNRAAKKAQTWTQLYDALAGEVPEGTERRQFLSKRPV